MQEYIYKWNLYRRFSVFVFYDVFIISIINNLVLTLWLLIMQVQFIQSVHNMKGGVKVLLIVGLLSVATIAKEDKEKEDIGTVIGIDLGTTYSWWVYIIAMMRY